MSSPLPDRPTDLSLSEMLHVLDVARTLRRDQEVAESELNQQELRAALRERLLASAQAAGDRVTPAEVDAAIAIYFQNLHLYRDPPWSLSLLLAHLYIRRTMLAAALGITAVALGLGWLLLWSPGAPLASATRQRAAAERRTVEIGGARDRLAQQLATTRALAEDPAAAEQLDRLQREADAAFAAGDLSALDRARVAAADLEMRLREEYEVVIVSAPGRLSGVERDFEDRPSGSYLIVEARGLDGQTLPRTIRSRETGETRAVREWGELVPPAVLSRIERDRRADGVVDERLFAVKRRGRLSEEVRLVGEDGQPLARQGQITAW